MYKILCYLVALLLSGTYAAFGQQPPDDPAGDVFANRKTTFTDHPLAGRVELSKNHMFDAWVMDRTASLPYPNPYRTQRP